ncbi:MAG: winged helix-turn-helix domain-containing protein, partial [Polyangiaceae bacterium]
MFVDAHVKRLRDKLGAAGRFIETVRGVGYRFNNEASPAAARSERFGPLYYEGAPDHPSPLLFIRSASSTHRRFIVRAARGSRALTPPTIQAAPPDDTKPPDAID